MHLTAIGTHVYPSVQQVVLMFEHGLTPGHTYRIWIDYTGIINEYNDDGLFRSGYRTAEGEQKFVDRAGK